MTTINTPTGQDEELKSRLEWLTDEQKDKLLEMLKEDKKLRENKNEWNSEKLINSELKYFDEIIDWIETMKKAVDERHSEYELNLFKSTFEIILDDINKALDKFKYYNENWLSDKNIKFSDLRTDILHCLKRSFRKRGWINQLMILLSYSRSPIIKDQMKEHWIDISLLESICSNVIKMLDELNMEVFVPKVLEDKFDENLYDYENSDVWIDKYFPNISKSEYLDCTIFDIISFGYKIKDQEGNIIESRKPTVIF